MSSGARLHAAAVQQALEGAGLTVYMGGAPDSPTHPYVAVYTDAGRGGFTSLSHDTDQWMHLFQTTSVGMDHTQALWAAEKVRTALAGVSLTVAGWSTGRIEHIMSAPVAVDYDAPTNVRYKFDQWRYVTVPTA